MPIHLSVADYDRDWPLLRRLFSDTARLDLFEGPYKNDPACYIVKAAEGGTATVVGASVWFIHSSTQTAVSSNAGPTQRPHVYLVATAAISNSWAARATQLLLQWGVNRADSLGLEVWTYTAASHTEMFRTLGFENIEEILTESESICSMRRPAVPNRVVHDGQYSNTEGFW
ncbi:hypothetical protein K458DRAFT_391747 [Lentithecium fluviatile CBS 122367]|uniref:N-acetyltransferase domain-containing protein n=1 Tax=Lentithecium fluviatile CBS 122367 TaxID=1168545 RepID=A0A6G1IU74_9PLEO|nr:hypothetical protein K458DRAFT_391747 [Lentithecium fluviatile CBS 122367]